jgi:LmbE family N-acetylglucosaminyl deacetylase
MKQDHWIFLSPHFDDVALSCGGLVWDLVNQGNQVEIWTVMAGYPPDENFSPFAQQNHRTWGKSGREAMDMRKEEDRAACEILGAVPHHLHWPDVIYRTHEDLETPVVNSNDELFNNPPEPTLVDEIVHYLTKQVPSGTTLVLPMGLGGHLDHRAVVQAGTRLPRVDFYYADYPYILKNFDSPLLKEDEFQKVPRYLSKESLEAWQDAILCYRSQLSLFWHDDDEERLSLRNYFAGGGGRLWEKK